MELDIDTRCVYRDKLYSKNCYEYNDCYLTLKSASTSYIEINHVFKMTENERAANIHSEAAPSRQ